MVALGSFARTQKPNANCKRLDFLKNSITVAKQGLMMSADTFGPGPKRRFEHPDQNIAFAEFPAVAGRTRYASRCEAADADLRGIGIALCGASAIITVASVTWLALSFS
ncbi:MAG TPA: hypothetical protein P5340_00130 [Defluviicoccus sp.]|nr:hypothetical protein [Defluviicoccus sp.]